MELTKLLLSLDPDRDPLGALLFIDYFALRARKYAYLRSMCNTWRSSKSLDWLPNFAYSEVRDAPRRTGNPGTTCLTHAHGR